MFNSYYLILFLPLIYTTIGAPIPIQLQGEDKVARMKFHLQLPTNETVQINLSFKLLTPSKSLPLYNPDQPENLTFPSPQINSEIPKSVNAISSSLTELNFTTETTTELLTTQSILESTSIIPEIPQFVTVEEAIESFRKNLIQKEMEIAGIIESEHPFYRHFKLEYGDGVVLPIRCTYIANYEEQMLTISCYEYRELGSQRIFSNGEYESQALQYTPEYINGSLIKQTYSMTIV